MRKKQKDWSKDMAYQRIIRLFDLARIEFHRYPERSSRYVLLARKISMRYRVTLPRKLKRQICRHCYAYLVEGATARTRIHNTYISTTCSKCGNQMRWRYRK